MRSPTSSTSRSRPSAPTFATRFASCRPATAYTPSRSPWSAARSRWATTMSSESSDADAQLLTLVHALRTPLTIVEGFADALSTRGDQMSVEDRAEYVERIHEAAREMRALLDGVRH